MRWMITFVGTLTILGGLLPLIKIYLPESLAFLPVEGPIYQGVIILIGVIAVVYGIKAKRIVKIPRGV